MAAWGTMRRSATVDDAEAIVLLTEQAPAARRNEEIPGEAQDQGEIVICQRVLSANTTVSQLVYEGDKLVACIVLSTGEYEKPETVEDGRMLIDSLMVHPDHWGRGGLASNLLAWTDELASQDIERITLWTELDNERSRALYERKGYVPTGVEHPRPRSLEPQLQYEKFLSTNNVGAPP